VWGVDGMKSNIDKYIEFLTDMHGLKLHWYQKQFLKMMCKLPKYKGEVESFKQKTIHFKNGSRITAISTNETVRGNRSKYIYPVYFDEIEGDIDEM
jgi:hypothetical protein